MSDPDSPATRLWVDRVFTIQGAGTVVTGTLTGGRIALDDELLISSTGERVRVRGLQSLKEPVASAAAVARVAVNLRGAKRSQIRRGDALIAAGLWSGVASMDVRLINTAPRLPREPILHVGSAAVAVRVRRLGTDAARLSLATTVPVHVGERAILRDPGEQRVVAGLIVLDTHPPGLSRRGAAARRAEELVGMTGEPDPGAEVRRRRAVRRGQLVAAGILRDAAQPPAGVLTVGEWLIDPHQWAGWQDRIPAAVDRWAAEHPLLPGMPVAALAQQLSLPEAAVLDPLVRQLPELTIDADGVHRRDAVAELPPQAEAGLTALVARLSVEPFAAPDSAELAQHGLSERHLAAATKTGRLLRIAPRVYLLPDAPEQAHRRLAALPQPFTMSQARQALDTTRRVALPLLELLDRRGDTVRVDSQLRSVRR